MSSFIKHLVLGALPILGMIAMQGGTAMADISPAGTAFGAGSRDAVFTYSGIPIRCTSASLTATTPGRGDSTGLSASVEFGFGGSCTAAGILALVTCTTGITTTLRYDRFAAPSGSGTIALDRNFQCTIWVPRNVCNISVLGPQTNAGSWNFTNGTQVLHIAAVNVAAVDTGGACSGNTTSGTRRGNGVFSGRYAPSTRLTFS